ncbi:hypothetical protein QVD17_11161 [Tagetes erecta]|uniref:Uncharacterized protein n=1 Tax=Tagetes erecta TaxID=13708 RepID=A0AAD8L3S0_TARER|nr:hypothetical protein QVD17_11161 [Tagetes erecta]
MSKNNKNTKVFLAEIQAIIRVPLTLTVNIKPDWTLGVDDAKAKSTITPPEASADTCNKIASTFERENSKKHRNTMEQDISKTVATYKF